MSDENSNVQNQPAQQVPNTGGPQVPGIPGKAPNMQGVPTQQAAGAPAVEDKPEEQKAPDFNLDALKALLGDKTESEKTTDTHANDEPLETGNAIIDAGISMLQKVANLNNSDVQRALGNAIKFNNPELIDSTFLKERFKEHADYAEMLCKAYYKEAKAGADNLVQDVYKAAGGQEQWNVLKDSFKAKAPAHQQAAARALIDAGKVQEGVSLIIDYCRSQGLAVVQGSQVKGQAGLAGAALSASEFSAEYAKLRKEAGNRSLQSGPFAQQYNSLLARRQAGKSIGR